MNVYPRELKNEHWVLLGIALFIVLQCFFVWNGGRNGVFNSPDANANYHFAWRLYSGQSLEVLVSNPESSAAPFLSTRSTRVVNESIVPVGFSGLLLIYGMLAKLLFINLIPYATIFFSGMGLYFLYRLTGHFFSEKVAGPTVLLAALHPAWWYYTNDSLVPNILFMSLALGTLYYASQLSKTKRSNYWLLGLLFFLAAAVRLSEVLWLLPVAGAILYTQKSKIDPRTLSMVILAVIFSAFFLWLFLRSIYATTLPLGYNLTALTPASGAFGSVLLPFGFHPRLLALNVWNYAIRFFWYYTIALILGFFLTLDRVRQDYNYRHYIILYFFVAGVVVLLYGSWQVVDSPNPLSVTIGNSFVRYFLPLYIFSIPIIILGWTRLKELLSPESAAVSASLFLIIVFLCSFQVTMTGSAESILQKRTTLEMYDKFATWIRSHTPDNAVLVTPKADKYLWPHRAVITSLSPESFVRLRHALNDLLDKGTPLYYVGTLKEQKTGTPSDWWGDSFTATEPLYTLADISIYRITRTNQIENEN